MPVSHPFERECSIMPPPPPFPHSPLHNLPHLQNLNLNPNELAIFHGLLERNGLNGNNHLRGAVHGLNENFNFRGAVHGLNENINFRGAVNGLNQNNHIRGVAHGLNENFLLNQGTVNGYSNQLNGGIQMSNPNAFINRHDGPEFCSHGSQNCLPNTNNNNNNNLDFFNYSQTNPNVFNQEQGQYYPAHGSQGNFMGTDNDRFFAQEEHPGELTQDHVNDFPPHHHHHHHQFNQGSQNFASQHFSGNKNRCFVKINEEVHDSHEEPFIHEHDHENMHPDFFPHQRGQSFNGDGEFEFDNSYGGCSNESRIDYEMRGNKSMRRDF